jgi:hypothetical protein
MEIETLEGNSPIPTQNEPFDLTIPRTPESDLKQYLSQAVQHIVTFTKEVTPPWASEFKDPNDFIIHTQCFSNPLYGPLLT